MIEAKAQVGHGEWKNWLADNFHLSYPTATKFMKIAERFSNVVSIQHLNSTQLIAMLALPAGEEENFIAEMATDGHPVEDMTVKIRSDYFEQRKISGDG